MVENADISKAMITLGDVRCAQCLTRHLSRYATVWCRNSRPNSVVRIKLKKGDPVNRIVFAALMCLYANSAGAQACWNEWEYKGQMLIRAGNCTENISMGTAEFPVGFCKSRVARDVVRTEAKCPATVKTKEGADVVSQSVVARCEGLNPLNVSGTVRILYYGGVSFQESRESLRDICVGLSGKWSQ